MKNQLLLLLSFIIAVLSIVSCREKYQETDEQEFRKILTEGVWVWDHGTVSPSQNNPERKNSFQIFTNKEKRRFYVFREDGIIEEYFTIENNNSTKNILFKNGLRVYLFIDSMQLSNDTTTPFILTNNRWHISNNKLIIKDTADRVIKYEYEILEYSENSFKYLHRFSFKFYDPQDHNLVVREIKFKNYSVFENWKNKIKERN